MTDSNVGLLVEFKAKYDTVTAGFNQISKGHQQLQQDSTKTEAAFTRMGTSINSSLSSIKTGLEALIIGVVFDKLIGGFNKIAEGILKVQNTAKGLGIPVDDFQKLAFAANLSDVNIDSLSTTLKRFSGNIGKAIEGDQNVISSLKSIGVSVDDLRGKGVADQLLLTVQAAGKLKDANIAAASGMSLFGRDYTQALRLGRDGIADNIKEFAKLGVILTKTQRDSIEEFNKSKKTLDTLWDGFLQKIVSDVSPGMTKLTDGIKNFILESGGIDGLANTVAGKITTIVDYTKSAFETFIPVVSGLIDGLNAILAGLQPYYNGAKQAANTLSDNLSQGSTSSHISTPGVGDYLYDQFGLGKGGGISKSLTNLAYPFDVAPNAFDEAGANANKTYYNTKGWAMNPNSATGGVSSTTNPYDNTGLQSIIPHFTEMTKVVDKTKSSVENFGDAVTKSADKITEGFKSIDGKALTDELNKIFAIISPVPVDKQTQLDAWTKQQREQLVANGQDTTSFDNQISANKGLNNAPDTSDFDKLAADLIQGLKSGNVSTGEGFNTGLHNLALQQQVDTKSGIDTDAEAKVIGEIKKFADSLGIKTQQNTVGLDISISASGDFIAKISESEAVKIVIHDVVKNMVADAAGIGAHT